MPARRSVSGSKAAAAPSRTAEAPTAEVLYNTAVQAFVRRDHVKTQATLARLLAQLKPPTATAVPKWYDLDTPDLSQGALAPGGEAGEELLVKTLKLVISANTSLYTDPPRHTSGLPEDITSLLPPTSPEQLLAYTQSQLSPFCADLLPPALLSTLLLASLKLKPASEALDYAHQVAEDWFTALPDAFILAIAPAAPGRKTGSSAGGGAASPERRKRVEGAREGYLKVVELFVGEVLAREGEFEMARAFLDGEIVMSSKRKEVSPIPPFLFGTGADMGRACTGIFAVRRHGRPLPRRHHSSFLRPARRAFSCLIPEKGQTVPVPAGPAQLPPARAPLRRPLGRMLAARVVQLGTHRAHRHRRHA